MICSLETTAQNTLSKVEDVNKVEQIKDNIANLKKELKIIIIGPAKSGKTSYISRLLTTSKNQSTSIKEKIDSIVSENKVNENKVIKGDIKNNLSILEQTEKTLRIIDDIKETQDYLDLINNKNKEFNSEYIPTTSFQIHDYVASLPIKIGGEDINIKIWDTPYTDFSKTYESKDDYHDTDAVILSFDYNSNASFKSLLNDLRDIKKVYENKPIIIIANKFGIPSRAKDANLYKLSQKENIKYYFTNAKHNNGIKEPFMYLLARIIQGDTKLDLSRSEERKKKKEEKSTSKVPIKMSFHPFKNVESVKKNDE